MEQREREVKAGQKTAAAQVSPEKLAIYRAAAQHQREQEQQERIRRRERAWEVARQAAELLRNRFGATRVVVFGSLIHEGCFTRWSDVDLAAWGLHPEEIFQAIGAVMDLDQEVEANLVDMGACRPSVAVAIEREGIEL